MGGGRGEFYFPPSPPFPSIPDGLRTLEFLFETGGGGRSQVCGPVAFSLHLRGVLSRLSYLQRRFEIEMRSKKKNGLWGGYR